MVQLFCTRVHKLRLYMCDGIWKSLLWSSNLQLWEKFTPLFRSPKQCLSAMWHFKISLSNYWGYNYSNMYMQVSIFMHKYVCGNQYLTFQESYPVFQLGFQHFCFSLILSCSPEDKQSFSLGQIYTSKYWLQRHESAASLVKITCHACFLWLSWHWLGFLFIFHRILTVLNLRKHLALGQKNGTVDHMHSWMKYCKVFQTARISVTNMLLLQKLCEFFWEKNQSRAMLSAINLKVLLKATSANSFVILARPDSWYWNVAVFSKLPILTLTVC